MVELDDLILYENENTRLDFKATQYKKDRHENFIRDVMSMANSPEDGDHYIIVGVKHKSDGTRDIVGIENEDFIDQAIYQQLIRENIEPEISVEWSSHTCNGRRVGVFLISKCFSKPYMMRKDFKSLKQGDCFIRKGTQQSRMNRRDFDRIIEDRMNQSTFLGEVQIGFGDTFSREIELPTLGSFVLPSEEAAQEINAILEERSRANELEDTAYAILKRNEPDSIYRPPSYSRMDTASLLRELEHVREKYREDDHYAIYERRSHKLNVIVLNEGTRYIEDATALLEIEKKPGLVVVGQIVERPHRGVLAYAPYRVSLDKVNYPTVIYEESSVLVRQGIGNIKHHIPTCVFKVPLRLVLNDELMGQTIGMNLRIFARNLPNAITENLCIKAVSRKSSVERPGANCKEQG